ncbi:MAG TPA: response regulator, partial [Candidatus Hydrogenedentes bacterium]|nr:response regulator [Candidatus Hydrogenedentota bacterium]
MSTSLLKILVVDDCREDRYTYRRFLEQSKDLSYTILETKTGEEGLALAREESPMCILLDYRLSDI